MKRNIYLLSYIPFLSILTFSVSVSSFLFEKVRIEIDKLGLYQGFSEYISETNLNMMLFIGVMVCVMMIFSFLKLLAETILKMSLLFFSKDREGEFLVHSQMGSLFYLGGGLISLLLSDSVVGIVAMLLVSTLGFFIYTLYRLGKRISLWGVVGVVFFQSALWGALLMWVILTGMKILNYIMEEFFLKIM